MFSKEVFAERVKQLREEKGVVQNDIAEYLNVTRSQIGEIERGRTSTPAERVYLLAEYFGVSSDYLLGLSDNKQPSERRNRMKASGKVHKYGDNVDTDVIIPARYLNTSDFKELAAHCMEDIDADFVGNVKQGDIMVGEANFGCGSSREHAPIAIKESGIDCVIAATFARIFYRNAINIGLPIMECREASERIDAGDEVEVSFDTGVITNVTKGETYRAEPFPEFIRDMISRGGLLGRVKG